MRTNTNIKKIVSKTHGILAENLATLLWKVMCNVGNGPKERTRCYNYILCLVAQSCLILGDPMNCSPPGSSVHGHSPGKNTGVGWPCFPSGDLPDPGLELRYPTVQANSLPSEPPGKPKNTGVGGLSFLQGIFLIQELNWGLLHCRWILN